jgi:hypothetical protein
MARASRPTGCLTLSGRPTGRANVGWRTLQTDRHTSPSWAPRRKPRLAEGFSRTPSEEHLCSREPPEPTFQPWRYPGAANGPTPGQMPFSRSTPDRVPAPPRRGQTLWTSSSSGRSLTGTRPKGEHVLAWRRRGCAGPMGTRQSSVRHGSLSHGDRSVLQHRRCDPTRNARHAGCHPAFGDPSRLDRRPGQPHHCPGPATPRPRCALSAPGIRRRRRQSRAPKRLDAAPRAQRCGSQGARRSTPFSAHWRRRRNRSHDGRPGGAALLGRTCRPGGSCEPPGRHR